MGSLQTARVGVAAVRAGSPGTLVAGGSTLPEAPTYQIQTNQNEYELRFIGGCAIAGLYLQAFISPQAWELGCGAR